MTSAIPFGFSNAAIARQANAVHKTLTGDVDQVIKLVDGVDIAIAAWPDDKLPDGVGYMLIKGHALLRDTAMDGTARTVSWTAIPCVEAEQAEALYLVYDKLLQRAVH